jgi:hypothetical protein
MGVSGQRHAPAALYPRGKNPRYPLDRRLGGTQSWSGRRGPEEKSAPVGDRTPIVQPVVRHCTAWATTARLFVTDLHNYKCCCSNGRWNSFGGLIKAATRDRCTLRWTAYLEEALLCEHFSINSFMHPFNQTFLRNNRLFNNKIKSFKSVHNFYELQAVVKMLTPKYLYTFFLPLTNYVYEWRWWGN